MSDNFRTVKDIVDFVCPQIDIFRRFPSKKEDVSKNLESVFNLQSEYLYIVVKDGKFAESFFRKMGKGRMRALKKILYDIDKAYYSQIDFKDE